MITLVGEADLTKPAVPQTDTAGRMPAGTIGRMPADQVAVVITLRDEADRIEATVYCGSRTARAGLVLVSLRGQLHRACQLADVARVRAAQ